MFTGGSSFTFWSTMERDLAPLPVVNRGFGGATMDDVILHADRVVTPYEPTAVVLFAGSNDIVGPRAESPRHVAESFSTFVAAVRRRAPDCLVYYVGITPTPAIWKWWTIATETNQRILDIVRADERLRFIDLSDLLLDAGNLPDDTLYGRNRHPNSKGYERWASRIKLELEKDFDGYSKDR